MLQQSNDDDLQQFRALPRASQLRVRDTFAWMIEKIFGPKPKPSTMIGDPFTFAYDFPLWALTDGKVLQCATTDDELALMIWTDLAAVDQFQEDHLDVLAWKPFAIVDRLALADILLALGKAGVDAVMVDPREMPTRVWRRFDLIQWLENTIKEIKVP